MSSLFQIGAIKVKKATDRCKGLGPLITIIKSGVMPIIQIGIPIALILLGTVDLGKAVIASDEDKIKNAQSMLIKRAIYAVAVFFVATLVTVIMSIVGSGYKKTGSSQSDTQTWVDCWNNN